MKSWLLLISILFSCNTWSQNLVSNPYVHKGALCPNMAPSWELGQNGNAIFNADTCFCNTGSPLLCMGKASIPFPKFFSGILGANQFLSSFGDPRSFLGTELTNALISGEQYVVEFYFRPWGRNNYHINWLGANISNDSITSWNWPNFSATVEINQPITDTTQWKLFSKSFIAQGGEQRLWIGNWRPDSQVTLTANYPNAPLGFNSGASSLVWFDGIFLYKATDTLYTVTLPQDTLLCPGETLDLVAVLDSGFKLQDTVTTYLWNNGSTDSAITVSQPGTYWVQSTINKRFVQTDTIVVNYFDAHYTLGLPDSIGFCENESANLLANAIPQTQYYWSNGDTTRGISIAYPTTIELTAITPCYTLHESVTVYQKQCEVYIYIPNAFTPDGNGTNDFFEFYGVPEPVNLLVFDRWGGIVFQSQDYRNDWDGTSLSGDTLPTGVYTYLIEYKYINPNATVTAPEGSTRQIRGTVNLVR